MPLLEYRVFFAQTLKLIFQVFVHYGWSHFRRLVEPSRSRSNRCQITWNSSARCGCRGISGAWKYQVLPAAASHQQRVRTGNKGDDWRFGPSSSGSNLDPGSEPADGECAPLSPFGGTHWRPRALSQARRPGTVGRVSGPPTTCRQHIR